MPFDPKVNHNPLRIGTTILECDAADNKTLTIAYEKKSSIAWLDFICRVYYWIVPNERLLRVRAVFNQCLLDFNADTAKLDEIANVYANCSYFTKNVITRHNESRFQFLYWTKVEELNQKKLETLEQSLKAKMIACHAALKNAEEIKDIATQLAAAAQLEKQTESLFAIQSLPFGNAELKDLRTLIVHLQKQQGQKLADLCTARVGQIENAAQIDASDLQFLTEMNAVIPQMSSRPVFDSVKKLIEERSKAQRSFQETRALLLQEDKMQNLAPAVNAITANKFVLAEEKQTVEQLHHFYDWFSKVEALNAKVLTAQADAIDALKTEVRELESSKLTQVEASRLNTVQAKIELIEKMTVLAKKWQSLSTQISVTDEMKLLIQETLQAAKPHNGMEANPLVVAVQKQAKATFDTLEAGVQNRAFWKHHFTQLKKNNEESLTQHLEMLASGEKKLIDNPEQAKFQMFLQGLPDGESKNEVLAVKKQYDEHLANAKQVVAQAKDLFAHYQGYLHPNHALVPPNLEDLVAKAHKSGMPALLPLAIAYTTSLKQQKIVPQLMQFIRAMFLLESTTLDKMSEMYTALKSALAIRFDLLELLLDMKIDFASLRSQMIPGSRLRKQQEWVDSFTDAKKCVDEVKRYQQKALAVMTEYASFQAVCDEYRQVVPLALSDHTVDSSKGSIPALVMLLDADHPLRADFFKLRWSYYLAGIKRLLQNCYAESLPSLKAALAAVKKEIESTPVGTDKSELWKSYNQSVKLLATLEKVHQTGLEWTRHQSSISTATVAALQVDTQQILSTPELANHPLAVRTAGFVQPILDKITGQEKGCAEWRKKLSDDLKHGSACLQNGDPLQVPDMFWEQPTCEAFIAGLPDGDEKTELTSKKQSLVQFYAGVKPYKAAFKKIDDFKRKLDQLRYVVTKSDLDELATLKSLYQEGPYASHFQLAWHAAEAHLKQKAQTSLQTMSADITRYEQMLAIGIAGVEMVCEQRVKDYFTSLKSQMDQQKTLLEALGFQQNSVQTIISRILKLELAGNQFLTFNSEKVAFEKARKAGQGPSATAFTPKNEPELISILGPNHAVAREWKELILTEYLRVTMTTQIASLSERLQKSDGRDLNDLSEGFNRLLKETTTLALPTEALQKRMLELNGLISSNMTLLSHLQDYVEKTHSFHAALANKESSELILYARAVEVTQLNSPYPSHQLVKTTCASAMKIVAEYEFFLEVLKKIEQFQTDDADEAQLEAFANQTMLRGEIDREIMKCLEAFPQSITVLNAKTRWETIQTLLVHIPAFRESNKLYRDATSMEFSLCEQAAASFGMGVVRAPASAEPALLRILGPDHPAMQSYMKQTARRTALRAFVDGCSALERQLTSLAAIERADACAQLDHFVPLIEKDCPQLVKKYRELTAVYRDELKSLLLERTNFHHQRRGVLTTLKAIVERPAEHKEKLSLHFFKHTDHKDSFFQRVLTLMGEADEQTRSAIETYLGQCFPVEVCRDADFVAKCSTIWHGDTAPVFTPEELQKLDRLIQTKGLPSQLQVQFQILKQMHHLQFHPKTTCPMTLAPLIHPVATKTSPVRYFERDVLKKWFSVYRCDPFDILKSMSMDDVEEKPLISQLVNAWLQIKDLMQPSKRGDKFVIKFFEGFKKESHKSLRTLALQCGENQFNAKKCLDSRDAIEKCIQGWMSARFNRKPQAWDHFLAEINQLFYEAISLAYPQQFNLPARSYRTVMASYVMLLHRLEGHLDTLFPMFRNWVQLNIHHADLDKLQKHRQLLHILLTQANAFTEKNFFDTQQYMARLLSDTYEIFGRLLKGVRGGFTGELPKEGAEPFQALLSLFQRIDRCNRNSVLETDIRHQQMIRELDNQIMKQNGLVVQRFMQQLQQAYDLQLQQQKNEEAVEKALKKKQQLNRA